MNNLKLIFKSLINNPAIIEGGRHRPWYFAVIIGVLSLLISVVPAFVQSITKQGDALVSSYSYGVEEALLRFSEDINDNDIQLNIYERESGKRLSMDYLQKWDELAEMNIHTSEYSYFGKDANLNNCWTHVNSSNNIDLQVYLLSTANFTAETIQKIAYTTSVNEKGETVQTKRIGSYLILSERETALYVQAVNKNSADVGSIYGTYSSITLSQELNNVKYFTLNSINDYLGKETSLIPSEKFPTYNDYKDYTWSNWKKFFVEFYNETRIRTSFQTTGLMLAVNTVLTFFMGLMVFILTRGKNNPFRIYTFWEGQKISYWAALSPALISLVLGFLLSQFSQIMFALLLGVRVMWLSMKTLRPDAPSPTNNYSNSKPTKTVDVKPAK